MQHLTLIHNKVPCRLRYRLEGLRKAPRIKAHLEQVLSSKPYIKSITANTVTGTLLITHNSSSTPKEISKDIQTALTHWEKGVRPKEDLSARPLTMSTLAMLSSESMAQPLDHWHAMAVDDVLQVLDVKERKGLAKDAWQLRSQQYGPNRLPQAESRSKWEMFWGQLKSLPVYLLGAAAGVSLLTGGILEAGVILGVVAANAVIGYVTESKAEKTIQSLKALVRPMAEVIRDDGPVVIAAEDVVPGDLLVLKPGFYVAADSRILAASHLTIDESMLTGESLPVTKTPDALRNRDQIPLGERVNMAYMGTLVTGGEGIAVAVATGRWTEIGQLQILLNQTRPPQTPMERQLERLGDQLVLMCLAICGIVFALGFFRGYGVLQMLRMAISLAAAAVPEGLPAAATINYALGISRMRKDHVLVRHLQAMETLGAVKTICLDKTGTLTLNRMTVQRLFVGDTSMDLVQGKLQGPAGEVNPIDHLHLHQLLSACVLCNETRIENGRGDIRLKGSATEAALVRLALDLGMDVSGFIENHELIGFNHRSENRLYMSSLHQTTDSGRLLSIKGSPPEVLALCDTYRLGDRTLPLTETARTAIENENERMAGKALRVLGFAYCECDGNSSPNDCQPLTWLGLVGMADPVREKVDKLIEVFHRAGVDTVMITGDQSATACAIADQLKLSGNKPVQILDSSELNHLDEETLQALAKNTHAFARVSPAHKLQIVRALQASGKIVAMTGDGINDGPALKAADIGIAMGRSGTDVARDVADVVLEEDQLAILAAALADGRAMHDNIRKTVHFMLATNISEILLMFAAMAGGIGFPLNVMQLLWINLISDILPGLALSLEAPEPGIMKRQPRDAQAPLFSGSDFKTMIRESGAITGGALASYGYGLARYGSGPAAGSLAFQSLTIAQLLHTLTCRSEYRQSREDRHIMPSNPYLSLAVGGSLALQALTLFFPPLRSFLGLSRIGFTDLALISGSAIVPFLLNQTLKPTRPPVASA